MRFGSELIQSLFILWLTEFRIMISSTDFAVPFEWLDSEPLVIREQDSKSRRIFLGLYISRVRSESFAYGFDLPKLTTFTKVGLSVRTTVEGGLPFHKVFIYSVDLR